MLRLPLSLFRETLLALVALALLGLNFGHASAAFAAEGRVVVTSSAICGDPLAPAAGEHFACHACRPFAAALPPPVAIVPVAFAVAAVCYLAPDVAVANAHPACSGNPRAPPSV